MVRRCDTRPAPLAIMFVAGLSALAASAVEARPALAGAAAVYVGPGYGARWVGGPYRPWVGPGWRYGYPGWRYGYPGWGYPYAGYGYGFGWGLGYGAGWAVATTPAWGWPVAPAAYVMPSWVPMGVVVEPSPFVEPAPLESTPPVPQAAPQQPGFWYYCTDPAGYYPYVTTCSRPWVAVQPTGR